MLHDSANYRHPLYTRCVVLCWDPWDLLTLIESMNELSLRFGDKFIQIWLGNDLLWLLEVC